MHSRFTVIFITIFKFFQLTLGDILLYNTVHMVRQILQKGGAPDPFEKYEKIKGHYTRIDAVPKIAEWVQKRPQTEM